MAQILRLAVAPVEPRKGAEQPCVALRRHQRINLGESSRIERIVGRAPCLDVAGQERKFEVFGHVDPRILQQRYQVIGGRSQHGILEVDDADFEVPDRSPSQIRLGE